MSRIVIPFVLPGNVTKNNILKVPSDMCNLCIEKVTSHCCFRGVLPFGQRKRLWEKHRAKSRKHRPSTVAADIVCGSQVCMKNSPMYQPGAVGMCGVAGF